MKPIEGGPAVVKRIKRLSPEKSNEDPPATLVVDGNSLLLGSLLYLIYCSLA